MFRKMRVEDVSFVGNTIGKINTSAKRIFQEALKTGRVIDSLVYEYKNLKGAFTVVEGEGYFSIQISFERDISCYKVISYIHKKINNVIKNKGDKEIYLNIYGYNQAIINYFKNYNFIQDSLGFEYRFIESEESLNELEKFNLSEELSIKRFEIEKSYIYLSLLDDSFRELNIVSNEEEDQYRKGGEKFVSKLKKLDEEGQFGALWRGEELVGVYTLRENYINTIAVGVEHQGKGYGEQIIKFCLKEMIVKKNLNDIYLHVYFNNEKAQKFYMKNGFEIEGYYCESTYTER